MHEAVGFGGTRFKEIVFTRYNECIGPVVAMIDDSAARRTPAELDCFVCRQLSTYKFERLAVAKSKGRAVPVIVTEARVLCGRVALQQQKIRRHVFGGAARAGWK